MQRIYRRTVTRGAIFRILAESSMALKSLNPTARPVSIFGSARTAATDPFYLAAQQTGTRWPSPNSPHHRRRSRHHGGGQQRRFGPAGTSVGLNITLPTRKQIANPYVNVSLDFHYFYARKVMFLKYAKRLHLLPGGTAHWTNSSRRSL